MREIFYNNAILRLINNDRVIGLVMDTYEDDVTILYAPMLVTQDNNSLSFVPYDNLSDNPFAIFDNYHIMNTNMPSPTVNSQYEENKIYFYPNIEDLTEEYKNQYNTLLGGDIYDFNNIQDMFNEFTKESKS